MEAAASAKEVVRAGEVSIIPKVAEVGGVVRKVLVKEVEVLAVQEAEVLVVKEAAAMEEAAMEDEAMEDEATEDEASALAAVAVAMQAAEESAVEEVITLSQLAACTIFSTLITTLMRVPAMLLMRAA